MSDVSGLELIRRLRPLPAFAGTPMIAVSANASERDERACLAQGANAFLPKPVDREQLLAVIASLLKLSWIRDPRQHAARDRQPGPEPGSLVGPPEQDLLQLQELARQGNMRDIVRWANSLSERESGRYGAFAAHVRRLAQTYQSQVLLRFAESFLQPEDVSGSVP
jgi:DNA-binding response OmpR family regulator